MTFDPRVSEWGNPIRQVLCRYAAGERRELKHLNTCRKRKQQ